MLFNQSVNIYFHDAIKRMRAAAKKQLVIESAAPYCSKFTTRKSLNATRKKLHKCAKLVQNMLFFFHQTIGTNYFLQSVHFTKKKHRKIHKNYNHKLKTKITTFVFYKMTKPFFLVSFDDRFGILDHLKKVFSNCKTAQIIAIIQFSDE